MKNILKSYKNLKVLVTGSTGFKGSWLCFWLFNLNAKVVGVGLKEEKDSILFKSLNLKKKIKQYYFDIKDLKKLNNLIKKEKPQIIFHLAAQSIVSSSYENPLKTFNSNIQGSINILETVRINNVQSLVFITSDKCYLNLDTKKSYKERDILGGLDNYSSSKASAELIFYSYFESYFKLKNKKLSIASCRAGNVIGGGDMKENRLVPDIVKSIKNNKKIKLRCPKSTRPWQHVLEPLSGYLILGQKLLKKKLNNYLYPSWNFGPEKKNCKEVIQMVNKVLHYWQIKKKIINNKFEMHESKFLSLNITKAKKELEWKPKLTFDETIQLTVNWYKNFFNKKNVEQTTLNQIKYYMNK